MEPAWGRCPLSHPEAVPGWLVPFDTTPHPHSRYPDTGVAVKLGIHPASHCAAPCIGSGQLAPPLPVAAPPTARLGLALQRAAMKDPEPAWSQAGLFGEENHDRD